MAVILYNQNPLTTMTKEEYKNRLHEIHKVYDAQVKALDKEYGLSNSAASIGDVVSSSTKTFTVESIEVNSLPVLGVYCVYFGTYNGERCEMSEYAIISINGKPFEKPLEL